MDSPTSKVKLLEKAAHLQPVPLQKSLVLLNHFSVSTVTFLNQFVRTVDDKLEIFSKSMDKLEVLLAILEAKLEKIEGPPAPAPTPAPAEAATPAPAAGAGPAPPAGGPPPPPGAGPPPPPGPPPPGGAPPPPGGAPPPPPGGAPPPPPGGAPPPPGGAPPPPGGAPPPPGAGAAPAAPGTVAADARYAQYFNMLASGTPREEVSFKMQSAGLDPNLLNTPNAPAPAVASAAAGAPAAPMLEIMDAPSTVLKCKDDPMFKKYFRMLQIGIPEGNVKQKMATDGVDSSVLDTPDGPSPNDPASTAVM